MLDLNGLTKEYGAFWALRGVSLHATDAEVFGLLGPNGAGKTTLLRILATLLQPTGGSGTVCGLDLRRNAEAIRRAVGVVNGGMGLPARLTGREILRSFAGLYSLNREATRPGTSPTDSKEPHTTRARLRVARKFSTDGESQSRGNRRG